MTRSKNEYSNCKFSLQESLFERFTARGKKETVAIEGRPLK
jgi:hypothetical protein